MFPETNTLRNRKLIHRGRICDRMRSRLPPRHRADGKIWIRAVVAVKTLVVASAESSREVVATTSFNRANSLFLSFGRTASRHCDQTLPLFASSLRCFPLVVNEFIIEVNGTSKIFPRRHSLHLQPSPSGNGEVEWSGGMSSTCKKKKVCAPLKKRETCLQVFLAMREVLPMVPQ